MNRFVKTLLNGIGGGRRSARTPARQATPGVESLEARNMPSGVTFSTLTIALALKTRADALKLANDAISAESSHPTLLWTQLVKDAQALKYDAVHGSLTAIGTDAGKLLRDGNTEAALVSLFHLSQTPLVKNVTVRQDAINLIVDAIDGAYLASGCRRITTSRAEPRTTRPRWPPTTSRRPRRRLMTTRPASSATRTAMTPSTISKCLCENRKLVAYNGL